MADTRSRSRDRGRVDPEQRRRAQSKSPARRPAPRYMDTSNIGPDISGGISRMFREFGGAFKAKMSKKTDSGKASSVSMSDLPQLKSNLKKQKQQGVDTSVPDSSGPSSAASVSQASDNKKVHFNKFATVQMMG